MSLEEITLWSLSSVISQGYPNLVLYYRLDNDYFIGKAFHLVILTYLDQISGILSPQSALSYSIVADNDMTLGCPIGFNFDWNAKNCYCKLFF